MTIYCIKKTTTEYNSSTVQVLKQGFKEPCEAEAKILSFLEACDDSRISRVLNYCDDDAEAPLYCVYYGIVCTQPYATQYIYTIEEIEI